MQRHGQEVGFIGGCKVGAALKLSRVQGPPFVQGTTIRDVFDSTAIWDEPLFSHHVFKLIRVKFSKTPLLGDMNLLAARELELGSA